MPEFTTVADLTTALARFDAEATHGELTTPRYRMRYVTWGPADGPPVVFVHGLCDLTRSFAMLMSRLVDRGFRCVGYELADGRDGADLRAYTHSHYPADLVCLLDHLGLSQVDLMGSSFGSTVTLRTLAEHPDRVRRAALQGGFARRPLTWVERRLAYLGRSWPWRMGQLPVRNLIMAKLELPMFVGCPRDVFWFLLKNSGRTPIRAATHRALILNGLDLRPLLPTIPHKVLMIGGERDTIVPRRYEAEVESGLKDVRRIEYVPCGHYPQYTLPGPMAGELAEFFG